MGPAINIAIYIGNWSGVRISLTSSQWRATWLSFSHPPTTAQGTLELIGGPPMAWVGVLGPQCKKGTPGGPHHPGIGETSGPPESVRGSPFLAVRSVSRASITVSAGGRSQ